jgi:hypothetical protein
MATNKKPGAEPGKKYVSATRGAIKDVALACHQKTS